MHPNTILHEVQQLYNVSDRLDFQPGIIVPVPLRQTLSAVTARVKRVNALLSANGVFAPNHCCPGKLPQRAYKHCRFNVMHAVWR